MMTKEFKIVFVVLTLLFLLVGTFYDFQISKYFYNPESMYGIILASYGMYPTLFFLCLASYIFILDYQKIYIKLLGIIALIYSIYLSITNGVEYGLNITYIQSTVISITIYIIPAFMFYRYLKQNMNEDILRLALFITLFILFQIVVVNIIKLLWLRPRMILLMNDTFVKFLPWYIKGIYLNHIPIDLIKSFPSAHTSSSAVILVIFVFCKNKNLCGIIVISYIVMVGLSRIIAGAHFLSDVTFGAFISFLIYNYMYKQIYIKNNIKLFA